MSTPVTMTPHPADEPPALLSIGEARRQLGNMSRNRLYILLAERQLDSVKLGRRRLVVGVSLDKLVARLTHKAGAA